MGGDTSRAVEKGSLAKYLLAHLTASSNSHVIVIIVMAKNTEGIGQIRSMFYCYY